MTTDAYSTTDCTSQNTGGFDSTCFGFNSCAVSGYFCTLYRFESLTDSDRPESGTDMDVVAIDTDSVAAGTNVISSFTLTGATTTTFAVSTLVAATYAILF